MFSRALELDHFQGFILTPYLVCTQCADSPLAKEDWIQPRADGM